MSKNICPSCGRGCVSPKLTNRPVLIVKDSVTQNEIDLDMVFTLSGLNQYGNNENTTSYYLQKEFGMVGLNMQSFSLTCLHMHNLPKGKRTKEDKEKLQKCIDFGVSQILEASKGKKIVFLMGAECSKLFTGYGVSEVSGLICTSALLPHVPVVIPAPNSDKLMAQPIGELRNSLQVLAEQVKILDQYMKI